MASIYKRGKIWWIHYTVGGKSVSRSLKTTNGRVALEKKKRLEALDITDQLVTPSNTPLAPLLQSFGEFLKETRTFKSAKNDLSYLRIFFGPICTVLELGSCVPRKYRRGAQKIPQVTDSMSKRHVPLSRLEDIHPEMVSSFIRERIVNDGISAKTANRFREVLHKMFNYAIEHWGYVCPDKRYKNPIDGVRRAKEMAPQIHFLSMNHIAEQLDVLVDHPVIYAMVATYIYAGLRREEALWLTHDDVDLSKRVIRVRAKTIDGESWQPKTKRNRVVPISAALLTILQEYRTSSGCIWFFPSPRGKRWHPDNFSQDLRAINKANGLSWSCLDFRHTFGSHLAQKGESLYKIATLMGNSPDICRRHYAALIPEQMADVVEFERTNVSNAEDNNTEELMRQILAKLDGKDSDDDEQPKLRIVYPSDTA